MDSYDKLPDLQLNPKGEFSRYFLNLKSKTAIKTFKDACIYVHHIPYGYNSDRDDKWALFDENMGSCSTKHGVIATLAEEMGIPLHKHVGIYQFNSYFSNHRHPLYASLVYVCIEVSELNILSLQVEALSKKAHVLFKLW